MTEVEYDPNVYGIPLEQRYYLPLPEQLPRNAVSPALANSILAFAGEGRLLGFTVTNTKASAQFVQVFGGIVIPADGAVPVIGVPIAANSVIGFYYGSSGRWFNTGCVLVNSSTQGTKTIGSADCIFDVQYVPQVI